MQIFGCFAETIKRKKALFVILLVLTITMIVLSIFSAISISNGSSNINLNNVPYIKFLQGNSGLPAFIFNCIMVVGLIYISIVVCFVKPYIAWLGVIFYLYFVYSQAVIFVSIIMIYGFFNVIILTILLLVLLLLEFALLLLIMLEACCLCNQPNYFGNCFNFSTSKLLLYTIILLCLVVSFCLITMILRSFVVLLVY